MRPMSDINEGDVYRTNTGAEWLVLETNKEERMVLVVMMHTRLPDHLNEPFWLKNTSALFRKRVQERWKIGVKGY